MRVEIYQYIASSKSYNLVNPDSDNYDMHEINLPVLLLHNRPEG